MKKYDYLIVGAGLYGAVMAYELGKKGKSCLVIDKRDHIAGNIYCEDVEGIHVHKYGAHIFHTSDKKIWDYINQFAEFNHYINSPVAVYKDELYNLPFNMNTFSRMWGIKTPEEAKKIITDWMEKIYPSDRELEISDAQLEKLTNELLAGYLEYVKGKGLPDPTKIGDHMLEYLNTADGQKRFSEGLVAAVDMDSLEQQLSKAMSSYMEQVMGTMSESVAQALEQQVQQMMGQITKAMESSLQQTMSQFGTNLQNAMGNAISIDADSFANAFQMNLSEEDLAELFLSLGSKQSASYDGNLQKLGYADFSEPSGINIYPKDFQSKEQVVKILDDYNTRMKEVGKEEQVITYTDVVGTLMSSVTDIVDIISYVLIAFVAISLVVSSIMIGVITYISVLERKKEIGILRAIGASKGNISQVFNAETFIIGLCAGLIGIGLTLLLLIPCNAVIHQLADTTAVSAVLPFIPAVVLILLSIGLTLLGGLIPSRKAAKSDPVTALRTE